MHSPGLPRHLLAVLAIAISIVQLVDSGKVKKLDLTDVVDPNEDVDPELYKKESNEGVEGVVGDIYVGKNGGNRNAASQPHKKWPRAVVPYIWDSSFDKPEHRQAFQEAVEEFQKHTCVKFVPRETETDYVRIQGIQFHCWSRLGREGGEQELTLSEGCYSRGTLLHEMLHTLGFEHEHIRSDRDNYVTVHFENMPEDENIRSQYRKLDPANEDTMGFPYDYSSSMHYGAFNVITAKDKKYQRQMGQRAGFSKQDIQEINTYYDCSGPGGTSGVEGVALPCEDANSWYCGSLHAGNNCADDERTIALCQKTCRKC